MIDPTPAGPSPPSDPLRQISKLVCAGCGAELTPADARCNVKTIVKDISIFGVEETQERAYFCMPCLIVTLRRENQVLRKRLMAAAVGVMVLGILYVLLKTMGF